MGRTCLKSDEADSNFIRQITHGVRLGISIKDNSVDG